MAVGIRELKAKLSEYVSRAANGEQIVVTDRGRPVARLVGLEGTSMIDRGIEEGWITPASRCERDSSRRCAPPRREASPTCSTRTADDPLCGHRQGPRMTLYVDTAKDRG